MAPSTGLGYPHEGPSVACRTGQNIQAEKIFQGSVRACSSKAMTVRSGISLTGAITGTRTDRFPATGRCREIEATRARKPAASDICPGIACFDQLSVLTWRPFIFDLADIACIQNYGCA